MDRDARFFFILGFKFATFSMRRINNLTLTIQIQERKGHWTVNIGTLVYYNIRCTSIGKCDY